MGYILSSYYKLKTSGPQFYTRIRDLELVLSYQIPKRNYFSEPSYFLEIEIGTCPRNTYF